MMERSKKMFGASSDTESRSENDYDDENCSSGVSTLEESETEVTTETETDMELLVDYDSRRLPQHQLHTYFSIHPSVLAQVPTFNPKGSVKRIQSVIEMIYLDQEENCDSCDVEYSMDDLENITEKKSWGSFSVNVKEEVEDLVRFKDPNETFKEHPVEKEVELKDLKTPVIQIEDEQDVQILEVFKRIHGCRLRDKISPTPKVMMSEHCCRNLTVKVERMDTGPSIKVDFDITEKLIFDDEMKPLSPGPIKKVEEGIDVFKEAPSFQPHSDTPPQFRRKTLQFVPIRPPQMKFTCFKTEYFSACAASKPQTKFQFIPILPPQEYADTLASTRLDSNNSITRTPMRPIVQKIFDRTAEEAKKNEAVKVCLKPNRPDAD